MADLTGMASKALGWFYRHRLERAGVAISNVDSTPYNEVSGYWIPTLLAYGQEQAAVEIGEWLASVQLANGCFRDCYGAPNAFDTGQVVRGLHELAVRRERFREPLRKACAWLVSLAGADHRPPHPFWEEIPEWILLYAYEPAAAAASFLGEEKLLEKARACVETYALARAPKDWTAITHFYAYWLEGMVDAGFLDAVRPHLERLARDQHRDGSVPALPRGRWVCTPGLAQIGLAWHKAGMIEQARRAAHWLAGKQNSSGGWTGSYGRGANYFESAEISWAAKFVLDLAHCIQPRKGQAPLNGSSRASAAEWASTQPVRPTAAEMLQKIRKGQRAPWTELLLQWTAQGESVLEVGTETAEMSANLGFHDRKIAVLDPAVSNLEFGREVLKGLGVTAGLYQGDIDRPLPFGDGEFDVVFSCAWLAQCEVETIVRCLREFGRVARRAVITFVPNAASLPYRIGKTALEARGKWPWRRERPLRSLRPFCEAAGLALEEETTVGLAHSLNFLRDVGLWQLADQLRANLPEGDCGNGYLVAARAGRRK